MPTAASIMDSSQLPLLLLPLMPLFRYTLRSIVPNRPEFGQLEYVYLMISAARGHDEPAQPVCSGALLFVWLVITADHASISAIDFCAYRASPVMYQISASVYAAIASSRSSVQP